MRQGQHSFSHERGEIMSTKTNLDNPNTEPEISSGKKKKKKMFASPNSDKRCKTELSMYRN